MSVDTAAPAASQVDPPTLADARTALERIYGPHTENVWLTLLHHANLSGSETDTWAIDRLLSVMIVGDPMARLCARGLEVRVATHRARLAQAKS